MTNEREFLYLVGCEVGRREGRDVGCLVEKWFNVCRARETFSE